MQRIITGPQRPESSVSSVPQWHGRGPAAPLGTYAKSIDSPPPGTGRQILQAHRAKRYELLSTARRILSDAGRAVGLVYGHDYHRTAKCKWVRRSAGGMVGVHLDHDHGAAFYSNLTSCGSVWACPICAAKIQERRREEIARAIHWAHQKRLQPVMVTLTFPHRAWHKLRRLLDQQAVALTKLRQGDPWKKFKNRVGYVGLIRSLELTHGQHGWHPHTHELWLVDADVDADAMRVQIVKQWESACIRAGLLDPSDTAQIQAFREHGVDVKGHCSASDYLAKQDDSRHWGADREIAKGATKAGKAKGVHAFGLLDQAGAGCRKSGRLYLAYCLAMRGKRQLLWSAGLKGLVGVDEISDEALAEQEREEADVLGLLTPDEWRLVRGLGQRAPLLDAAEADGWAGVVALLEDLRRQEDLKQGVHGGRSTPWPTNK